MSSLKRQSTHRDEEEEAVVPSPNLPVKKRPRREDYPDHDQHEDTTTSNASTTSKHVHFASHSEVHEINDNLTEKERCAMYMSNADQKRIFLEISETLAAIDAASENDSRQTSSATTMDEGMILRGLECIVQQKHTSNRGRRMKAAVNAVMKRQRFHEIDEGWIVYEYRPALEESKKLARERGLQDEVDA
ncbi:MAG: hypothetical protein SGARI_004813, partial [Bacillariaceae sp.]